MREPLTGLIVRLAFTVRGRNVAQDTETVNTYMLAYRPRSRTKDLPDPLPQVPLAELDLDRLVWDQEYRDEMRCYLQGDTSA